MWGEEAEASLWRDRDTGAFLDVMCGWVRNAKNVRILLDKETVGCGLCLQMAMIRDEDT